MSKRLRSLFLVTLVTAVAAPFALGATASAADAATRSRTITVIGTGEVRGTPDVADLAQDFHATHDSIFAVSDPESEIETVAWMAEVRCRIGSGWPGRLRAERPGSGLPDREVHLSAGGARRTPVYRLESIADGAVLTGPAILESGFTTLVLDERASAFRDRNGTIVIELVGAEQ